MLIKNEIYQKYIELADRISGWIQTHPEQHAIRSPNFFPLAAPIYKNELVQTWVADKGPTWSGGEVIEAATKGFNSEHLYHPSPLCCGLREVRSGLIGTPMVSYYHGNSVMQNRALAKFLGYESATKQYQEEVDLAATAWRLRLAGGNGLLIYTAPLGEGSGYLQYINRFEKFGFIKIAEFANGAHGGHRVGLWACHAPNISLSVGNLSWDVSGIMKSASIVAPETTLESGKTAVSSVSAVVGGKAPRKKAASKNSA